MVKTRKLRLKRKQQIGKGDNPETNESNETLKVIRDLNHSIEGSSFFSSFVSQVKEFYESNAVDYKTSVANLVKNYYNEILDLKDQLDLLITKLNEQIEKDSIQITPEYKTLLYRIYVYLHVIIYIHLSLMFLTIKEEGGISSNELIALQNSLITIASSISSSYGSLIMVLDKSQSGKLQYTYDLNNDANQRAVNNYMLKDSGLQTYQESGNDSIGRLYTKIVDIVTKRRKLSKEKIQMRGNNFYGKRNTRRSKQSRLRNKKTRKSLW